MFTALSLELNTFLITTLLVVLVYLATVVDVTCNRRRTGVAGLQTLLNLNDLLPIVRYDFAQRKPAIAQLELATWLCIIFSVVRFRVSVGWTVVVSRGGHI